MTVPEAARQQSGVFWKTLKKQPPPAWLVSWLDEKRIAGHFS
jgi:hypothetical protein